MWTIQGTASVGSYKNKSRVFALSQGSTEVLYLRAQHATAQHQPNKQPLQAAPPLPCGSGLTAWSLIILTASKRTQFLSHDVR